MEIQVNDFNFAYNKNTDKYELYSIDNKSNISIYKKYQLDHYGRVSQNILNDITDLTKLGYRFNPNLVKTIPEKK